MINSRTPIEICICNVRIICTNIIYMGLTQATVAIAVAVATKPQIIGDYFISSSVDSLYSNAVLFSVYILQWFSFCWRKCLYCWVGTTSTSLNMSADDTNLETILKEVGEFGIFQITTYFLFSIPTILSAAYAVNYMISANTLDYRWVTIKQ